MFAVQWWINTTSLKYILLHSTHWLQDDLQTVNWHDITEVDFKLNWLFKRELHRFYTSKSTGVKAFTRISDQTVGGRVALWVVWAPGFDKAVLVITSPPVSLCLCVFSPSFCLLLVFPCPSISVCLPGCGPSLRHLSSAAGTPDHHSAINPCSISTLAFFPLVTRSFCHLQW